MATPSSEHVLRWRLYARTPQYRKHLEWAREAVDKAASTAQFMVSWSTGKDSTAMAHLVHSMYPETPIVTQYDDCDWPSKRAYADRIEQAMGWKVHRVEPSFSVWERMRMGRIGLDEFCALTHSLTQDAFLAPLAKIQRKLGCDGVYMGLRAEESKARRANLSKRHEVYKTLGGEWRCCPIARWTADDVFAYHIEHGIEINPCYFNNRFLKPEEIRVSWAVPTPGARAHGEMEHFRYYYPEQFRKLRDMEIY